MRNGILLWLSICISAVINRIEHLLMFIVIWIFSCIKCLFTSFTYISVRWFVFYLLLYKVVFFFKAYYNPLLLIGITHSFSYSGGLPFHRCPLMNEVLNFENSGKTSITQNLPF